MQPRPLGAFEGVEHVLACLLCICAGFGPLLLYNGRRRGEGERVWFNLFHLFLPPGRDH